MRANWSGRLMTAVLVSIVAVGASIAAQDITNKDVLDGFANPARWLSNAGDYTGQRHSPLTQITPANVGQLTAQWAFQTGLTGHKFETTPIVIDGILYATGAMNTAWAIDGKTGKQIWRYQRQLPAEGLKVCCGMVNRGFAVYGDRLFMLTLDAHLMAFEAKTGKVVWDVELAKYQEGYAATGAPLLVKDKLIVGVAGGEYAIRGFLDAYDVKTGTRVWRFNTIPAPGEPGSETWPVESWERGGAPTWVSGSYDPELNTLYWGTGNPNPDFWSASRLGDNLYATSMIALDADTGKLRWHYQFTPHDTHDWDSNQVPVIANLTIAGQPRKVVMTANRNGFFYVLDRTNGKVILAKPYVNTTWAKEVGADGRPIEMADQKPTPAGTLTCPDLFGGTNFQSPAFNPALGLFFVSARETCMTYIGQAPPANYKAGDRIMGGSMRPQQGAYGALRAIDPTTGERKWELRQTTPPWSGVLSTAAGLVFSGDADGYVFAVDARTGKDLWRYQTGSPIYAPPTTYMIDNRQYVIMPSGSTLTAFALPASTR